MKLVGVEAVPFRVQMVGHVGSGPTLRGIFIFGDGSRAVLASAGEVIPEAEVAVVDLRLVAASDSDDDAGSARATIRGEPGGASASLREGERLLTDEFRARIEGPEGAVQDYGAGDILRLPLSRFRVEQIASTGDAVTLRALDPLAPDLPAVLTLMKAGGGP